MTRTKKLALTSTPPHNRRNRQKGSTAVETAFLMPWILFLFMGTVDVGFYGYAALNIQNAARVAAMQTSASSSTAGDSTLACTHARAEMASLAELSGVSTCGSLPLMVTATALTAAQSADGSAPSSQVAVTYRTPQLIPIPGMTGRLTLTRTAQMRVRD